MTSRLIRKHQPLALAVALALGVGSAHAANITVTDGGDAGTAATCTLRQAIVSAVNDNSGTSTCVAGAGADVIDFDGSLAGATITLGGSQLAIQYSTVTINGSGQTINGDGASRDLYLYGAVVDISNLHFVGGNTANSGGGIASYYSDLTLIDSTVSGNSAGTAGGGIASKYGSGPDLTGQSAQARHRSPPGGGSNATAGTAQPSRLTLVNSTVTNNSSRYSAGGIYLSYTQFDISGSIIANNQLNAVENYGGGGAYITGGSQGSISDSTISGNTATGGNVHEYLTGGLYIWSSAVDLTNSTVAGNSASGAAYVAGGVSNSYGSGADGNGYGLDAIDTTISGNSASSNSPPNAGGVLVGAYEGGDLTLINSINSGNIGESDNNLYVASGSATADHSLLGSSLSGSYAGNGNVFNDNPGLGALANNGGPTMTMTMALQSGSPAIDAGDNSLIPAGVQYDQRGAGYPRIHNSTVDIGSFEFGAGSGSGGGFTYVAVPASSIWSKGLLGLLAGLFGTLALVARRRRSQDA